MSRVRRHAPLRLPRPYRHGRPAPSSRTKRGRTAASIRRRSVSSHGPACRVGRASGVCSTSRPTPAVSGRSDSANGQRGAWSAGRAAGSVRCAIGRRSHDRLASSRCRRSEALAGDAAGLPRRPPAAQQGAVLSGGPADGGGDCRGDAPGRRRPPRLQLRALIIVLWRGGCECRRRWRSASATPTRGAGRCWCATARAAGAARSAWTPGAGEQLQPWLVARVELSVGPLFCIIDGPTRGRPWSSAGVRVEFRRLAAQAGLRRRFAPHQLRHANAVELAREGVALNVIQRQLGHANLGTTSIYFQGIDTEESSPPCTSGAPR
jgi:hypothetical protein